LAQQLKHFSRGIHAHSARMRAIARGSVYGIALLRFPDSELWQDLFRPQSG